MLEVLNKDGKIIKISQQFEFVTRKVNIKGIEFQSGKETMVGTLEQFNTTREKIIIPFTIGFFSSTPLYDAFQISLIWRYNGIFIVTDKTQKLEFEIIWTELK